jgi:hypothetical protein
MNRLRAFVHESAERWRTAIYRQMGHPELEDLLDGKKWLAEQANSAIGIWRLTSSKSSPCG